MGEVVSYTKAAIDAMLASGGGGGGGGGIGDVTEEMLNAALLLKADVGTVEDLAVALAAAVVSINAKIPLDEKHEPNGVAALGPDGLLYDDQFPLISAVLERIELSNIALGVIPAASAWVWTEVAGVAKRGLLSRIMVSPSLPAGPDTMFDLELRDAPAGGGELFLQAIGVPNQPYESTTPIYIEGDPDTRSVWVGVRNTSIYAATFTLTALRVERFA